jgi:1,3-beta-glucan synthase
MRTQTLYRTVRGMMQYERALHLLLQSQRPELTVAERREIVASKFQCVVSMQRYAHFDATMLAATEELFTEFPLLEVAFIDEEVDASAPLGRRYWSCLIDGGCALDVKTGRRLPRVRVELPGHPILGDGKGDNQNHALPFVRGRLVQTIDANQDGYIEEALKVTNALAEFAPEPAHKPERPSLVGFREHVFSALGSVAHFAASSEFTFGTIIQRTLDRPLAARLYYGHPDIMEKLTMMAQGGVSKATKGLNLSEDVFAGMDLTLRGGNIVHREYLQVGKGMLAARGAALADRLRG